MLILLSLFNLVAKKKKGGKAWRWAQQKNVIPFQLAEMITGFFLLSFIPFPSSSSSSQLLHFPVSGHNCTKFRSRHNIRCLSPFLVVYRWNWLRSKSRFGCLKFECPSQLGCFHWSADRIESDVQSVWWEIFSDYGHSFADEFLMTSRREKKTVDPSERKLNFW